jgi:hypothetical protein
LTAEKIAVDALGLAQLHRKVKDDSDRKYRAHEKEREKQLNFFSATLNNAHNATGVDEDSKPFKVDLLQTAQKIDLVRERGGIRKKYQVERLRGCYLDLDHVVKILMVGFVGVPTEVIDIAGRVPWTTSISKI